MARQTDTQGIELRRVLNRYKDRQVTLREAYCDLDIISEIVGQIEKLAKKPKIGPPDVTCAERGS